MSNLSCQCCKQQRANLNARKSGLINSINVIMCRPCAKEGHEPRHVVVLAAKSGMNVSNHVKDRKYCGKSLEAVEVLP